MTDEVVDPRISELKGEAYGDFEYHQARVLILVEQISGDGSFDGLTKLAKLDFLLRYPSFLERLLPAGADSWPAEARPIPEEYVGVESRMIRYKYGPWDNRYYPVLGALVGQGLIDYAPSKRSISIKLTPQGRLLAASLSSDPAWEKVTARCQLLKKNFGRLSGNALKELIYDRFPEVVALSSRAIIDNLPGSPIQTADSHEDL